MHLRERLPRGERGPPPPRHSLAADATKSATESFITSWPWYAYAVDEEEEERTRLDRIPCNKRLFYNMSDAQHVATRSRESGGWSLYAERRRTWPGWKWKHESPSPEPEDLSNMELTPSEIDALEAIPPPTPSLPASPSPPAPKPRTADKFWNNSRALVEA